MGSYSVFLVLLCAIPHIQCKVTSKDLKSPMNIAAPKQQVLAGNHSNLRAAVELRITEIRSDGVIFEWDKKNAWLDENRFTITVTPDNSSNTTPWPKSCSEDFICHTEGKCSKDTKNIFSCGSVPGCSEARITITGGSISSSIAQGNINIVTGPSSGKYIPQGQTPDYTPSLDLHTDSDGTIIVVWQGPPSEQDGVCADNAYIQTWVDGTNDPEDNVVKTVKFDVENVVPMQLPGLNTGVETRVTVQVTYLVKADNTLYTTKISDYDVITVSKNGAEKFLSSTVVLVYTSLAYVMINKVLRSF